MRAPPPPQNSRFDMVQWMTPQVREAFHASASRRRLVAGQILYVFGDAASEMYRIVSGSVRLLATRTDGREVVFLRLQPGDCFGEASLIDNETRPQTAQVVTDVELEVIDAAAFRRLRATYREYDEALLRLLSNQMRFASGLFIDLSLNDLIGRVARRILEAAQASTPPSDGAATLELPLSQAEIASMVGASRQTVNRALQQMQTMGLLHTEYNRIIVQDLDWLRSLATLR
jgi:CRP/FNR family transcriptional regulator, cyclic AMP receptor protein